jgi:alkanesulfonate monooxygenase SsuD/methylene tetrahydromethanopterin reductase-like flavin-dependent oxidoreductase (luciferase family)
MCTCNSYRPPSYLAKVAASIDVISGGRLEMGIGAGWYEHEYDGYGYSFPKPSVRIGMLGEGVEIMQRMWTEDEVTFEGRYYKLTGAICRPKPVQDPHIPFWIAGGGEKLTLNVAARYAAYTNFGMEFDEFVHKSEILEQHCLDVGTDFRSIVRSSNFNVVCGETEQDVDDRIGQIKDRYRAFVDEDRLDRIEALFRKFAGTPDQLVAKFGRWLEVGMTYGILYFPDAAYDPGGLELFAREVMPAFT